MFIPSGTAEKQQKGLTGVNGAFLFLFLNLLHFSFISACINSGFWMIDSNWITF